MDRDKQRKLCVEKCERWYDRDLVTVMNISRRGWLRFVQSNNKETKGGIGREAMKWNPTTTVIQRVDEVIS